LAGAATVEKALDVLFHLHGADHALGLSEIGRDLDLPKSSCHRLLAALMDREIVEQDELGRYRPGLGLLSLGLGAQAIEPVVRAARPVLESEAMSLGETVFLVARRRAKLRVLDKCDGSSFLRAAPDVGDEVPVDVTAAGAVYRVFGREVPGDGRSSDLAPAFFDSGDADTRERGYATNRDAWIEGLSVLAVPIWQERARGQRELVGTLALGAASPRFESLGEAVIAARLLAAADQIRDRMGPRRPDESRPSRRAQRRPQAPNAAQEPRK
jgi:IclR family acetate operon transcriptional repressor